MYNFHRKPLSTLLDLDELIFYCTEDKVKPILLEAINCYKAQAYRASILTCWIAVTVDAGFKIQKLAELGNGTAINLQNEQENIIINLNSGNDSKIKDAIIKSMNFENELSKKLLDLNVINQVEQNYLNQLKDDRNLCGHPSYTDNYIDEIFQPSAEHARMHLRRVVDVLLSKNVVDDIFNYISRNLNEHLWLNKSNSIEVLKKKGFEYLPDKQLKELINKLMWGFINSDKKEAPFFHNKNVISILKYFQEINKDKDKVKTFETSVLKELNKIVDCASESDKNNWLKFFLNFSEFYPQLEKENQEKIINNLNKSDLIITNKKVCKKIVENNELEAGILNLITDIEKLICLADANVSNNSKKQIYLDKFLELQKLDIHQQNINQLLRFYLVISNFFDAEEFLKQWQLEINLDDAISTLSADEFEKYFNEIFKLKPDFIESKLEEFKKKVIKNAFKQNAFKQENLRNKQVITQENLYSPYSDLNKNENKHIMIILQKLLLNLSIKQDLRKLVFDTLLLIYGLINNYSNRNDFSDKFLKYLNLNRDEAEKFFYMTLCNNQLYGGMGQSHRLVEFLKDFFNKGLLNKNILFNTKNLNYNVLDELKQQIQDIIIPDNSNNIQVRYFFPLDNGSQKLQELIAPESNPSSNEVSEDENS